MSLTKNSGALRDSNKCAAAGAMTALMDLLAIKWLVRPLTTVAGGLPQCSSDARLKPATPVLTGFNALIATLGRSREAPSAASTQSLILSGVLKPLNFLSRANPSA